MGLNIYLEVVEPHNIYFRDIIHDIIPMWKLAGVYNALYKSEDMKAKDILPELEHGIKHMEKFPEKYIKLSCTNGYGSYKNALIWLITFQNKCKQNPNSIIRVSEISK